MIKVGITGGIGSGKTTICKIFELYGIPVYYADDRAKSLMVKNRELKKAIIELVGQDAYFKNGRLNRRYVADVVFNDKNILTQLNGLVHPAVAKDGEEWFESQQNSGSIYALKEAALLIESGSYKLLDKLIVVTAPLETRIKRVMSRDKVNRKSVEARIQKQMNEEERLSYADFVIENNEMTSLIQQVNAIHHQLFQFST
jgi:dephospho-CoA kinase